MRRTVCRRQRALARNLSCSPTESLLHVVRPRPLPQTLPSRSTKAELQQQAHSAGDVVSFEELSCRLRRGCRRGKGIDEVDDFWRWVRVPDMIMYFACVADREDHLGWRPAFNGWLQWDPAQNN
jgi:hypothetical protein